MLTTAPPPYPQHEVKNHLKPGPLDGLSIAAVDQHWTLYKGYVTNTNRLNKALWDAVESGANLSEPTHAEIQRRLGFEMNGVVLHELYFGALKKGTPPFPLDSELRDALVRDFGSVDHWRTQFGQIGALRGTGWVTLSMDPATGRLANFWITQHEIGHVAGWVPLVALDVWEHAFLRDFGSLSEGRASYIESFFRNLDWSVVAGRFAPPKTSPSPS